MRRVRGETGQRLPDLGRRSTFGPGPGPALASPRVAAECSATVAEGAAGAATGSTVAVSIPDPIERFDLREIRFDVLEFLSQALDLAVDRPFVDINVLAISRIHQLVAVFDVPRTVCKGFEDQELGHRQLDVFALPGAQMPRRVEDQLAAHDYRLPLRIVALACQLAAPDQRPDALDQQALRKRLSDVVVGAHAQTEQLVDLVVLRGQEDDRDVALPPQLAEQLHAV